MLWNEQDASSLVSRWRGELQQATHGMAEDLPVRRTAEIVQEMAACLDWTFEQLEGCQPLLPEQVKFVSELMLGLCDLVSTFGQSGINFDFGDSVSF